MSQSEIVLFEQADEIIASLPVEMQNNPDISDFVIEALENKISKIEIRTTALEIGQEQLKQAMTHGFNLVNNEIIGIKHEAEKERIHAEYTKKEALEAKNFAQQALQKVQEVVVGVARAEEKAEGAKELSKQSRHFMFDPLTGMTVCAVAIVGCLVLIGMNTRVERRESVPSSQYPENTLTCGIDVTCIPNKPLPARDRGGV